MAGAVKGSTAPAGPPARGQELYAGSGRKVLEEVRATFQTGVTWSLEWRHSQLQALARMLDENELDICRVLKADLGKPYYETKVHEIELVKADINLFLSSLQNWAHPHLNQKWRGLERMLLLPNTRIEISPEPYGVVFVIAPWSFPFLMTLQPLAGAIAAGNSIVLKPSETAPTSAMLLQKLVRRYLDQRAIRIITPSEDEMPDLLELRWDKIFFSGATDKGKLVLEKAARHVTPVTLELGSKTPAIVAADADLREAAKRILAAKVVNAGQSPFAPDYVLVHERVADRFISAVELTLRDFFSGRDPKESNDYGRIVSLEHFDFLRGLLEDEATRDSIVIGGQYDSSSRYMAPTILRDPPASSPVWRSEIYGPILPVVTISDLDELFLHASQFPPPQSVYLFTQSEGLRQAIQRGIPSGSLLVNDAGLQALMPDVPYGGVRESGIGAYHGKKSFHTFSKHRAIVRRGAHWWNSWSLFNFRYPPYTWAKQEFAKVAWLGRLPFITGVLKYFQYSIGLY